MSADASFFSELDFSPATIQAAMASGLVTKWRVDASGTQWFQTSGRAMIRAIPPAASAATDLGDGDLDDGDVGDDPGGDSDAHDG